MLAFQSKPDPTPLWRLAGCAALALFLGAPAASFPSLAWQEDEKQEESEESEEEDHEEEEESPYLALVGGDVHTGTGAVLRGATILCKDDKIEEIGYELLIPEDAETLDISGYRVYPGLVAISSFGLFGSSGDINDSVDPFSNNMLLAVSSGLTTAVNGAQAAKLKRGFIDDLVVAENFFASMSFNTSNPSGKRTLRQRFADAAEYQRQYRQWQEDVKKNKELKEPKTSGIDSNVLAVLRGEKRALFSSNDRRDLLEIARLAQQYGFRPIISGCREGWTVADELGRAGASAIITARDRRNRDVRLVRPGGSSIENAAILHNAGVQVAIISSSGGINSLGGIVGRDIMHLPTEAAFAVRGGLSNEAALDAITIVPARLLGLDHRIGTIEEGKDADLIITDGDVLHYKTYVQWSVIGGELVYDKEAELYFAHIRPRPETDLAPEGKDDVGESPEEVVEEEPAEEGEAEGEESEESGGDPEEGGGQ